MIRHDAAAHASGSPLGFSNSVNHFTLSSLSPIVVNLCSYGNEPPAVVSRRVAMYAVAPASSPTQPIVPIRRALAGAPVEVPPSKSVSNRELILSALASGVSHLDFGRYDPGDDVRAMRDSLEALGYAILDEGAGRLRVIGSPVPPEP